MNNRRALITGGASGFGLSTAQALLAQGAQVAIADIDAAKLQTAADQLSSDRLLTLEIDVTSPPSVQEAVAACATHFGGLDALVNSAGVIHFGLLEETTEADWDRVIDIDLKGVFLCCQAADIPLGRNPVPADIVNAILFFLAAESSFLTGVALDVDGGLLSTSTLPGVGE